MSNTVEIQVLTKIKKANSFLNAGNTKAMSQNILQKPLQKETEQVLFPQAFMHLTVWGFTQMPMNVIYLTDGAARKIKVGITTITFKKQHQKMQWQLAK